MAARTRPSSSSMAGDVGVVALIIGPVVPPRDIGGARRYRLVCAAGIGPEGQRTLGIQGLLVFGRIGKRGVGRIPRHHEKERLRGVIALPDEFDSLVRHERRIVALGADGLSPGGVVLRLVVVGAGARPYQRGVKPERFRAGAAEVPFADVPGAVAGALKHFPEGGLSGVEVDVVVDDPLLIRPAPGHQYGAMGRADRVVADGVGEFGALGRHGRHSRRADLGHLRERHGLPPVLVAEQVHDIGAGRAYVRGRPRARYARQRESPRELRDEIPPFHGIIPPGRLPRPGPLRPRARSLPAAPGVARGRVRAPGRRPPARPRPAGQS